MLALVQAHARALSHSYYILLRGSLSLVLPLRAMRSSRCAHALCCLLPGLLFALRAASSRSPSPASFDSLVCVCVHVPPSCLGSVHVHSTANGRPGGASVRVCLCIVVVTVSIPCVATLRSPFHCLPSGRLTRSPCLVFSTTLPRVARPSSVPSRECSPWRYGVWMWVYRRLDSVGNNMAAPLSRCSCRGGVC